MTSLTKKTITKNNPMKQVELDTFTQLCGSAWAQNKESRAALDEILYDVILDSFTKGVVARCLSTLDGRNSIWPMSIKDGATIASRIVGNPVDGGYFEIRKELSDAAFAFGTPEFKTTPKEDIDLVKLLVDKQEIVEGTKTKVKLYIDIGRPYDGHFGVKTGTVTLGLLMRALNASHVDDRKIRAMAAVLRRFQGYVKMRKAE